MIELKDLTEMERIKISSQCEPVFLVYKKQKVFTEIFNRTSVNLKDKYHKELWLVLTCILKGLRYGAKGTRISLNKNHYTLANKVHGQGLYLPRLKKVLDHLDELGFIYYYKGYKLNEKEKMTTCVIPTDKFLSFIDMDKVKRFAAKRDPLDYIEVKGDSDGEVVMLSLKDFRGYTSYAKHLERYNILLSNSRVEASFDGIEYFDCSLSYKRVFFQGFDQAGRFYSTGSFQTMKSESRKHLKINGLKTTEVDFCNLHPRLLYTLEGIKLPIDWDAYCLENITCDRTFIKKAYLSVLFSESKEAAIKSILYSANKGGYKEYQNKPFCEELVNTILEKNKPIHNYFFQEKLWAKLQNLDGRLASYIIYKFTSDNDVCLGWHDSFVVTYDKRSELINIMKEAWYNIFGTYENFKVKVEY